MTSPTTTGTYAWAPPLADLIINAYGRIQIRRPDMTVEHLADAATCCNLLQTQWANKQVNLWTVDLQTQLLSQGTDTYVVDPATLMVLAAYIETGSSPPQDRIIISIDRDSYASYPDKTTQGAPTVYWFQKLIAPQITVWQPPDGNGPYTLKFYRARQIQDASAKGGLHAEVPYYFLEAYTAHLAVKLAGLYARELLPGLRIEAKEAWDEAANRNTEDAAWRIIPAMAAYTSAVY